ncbi:hypothetical protein QVD17_29885 [Tagetes erecta]|uniref:Uncharacterized protein n=1 Tax=Tagetes erecta TaxID=13708 RepID=A0AAD8K0G4_TARER|nr:hypothetical protein QVD17_29885 [Tagetes erecta]
MFWGVFSLYLIIQLMKRQSLALIIMCPLEILKILNEARLAYEDVDLCFLKMQQEIKKIISFFHSLAS